MKRRFNKLLVVFGWLVLGSSGSAAYAGYDSSNSVEENHQVESVSFCELMIHPERYANKLIKTSAIFVTHFPDVWFMYDQRCSGKDNRVSEYLNCKSDSECNRLKKLAELYRDGDGEKWRNQMVVIGELQIVERQNRAGELIRLKKFAILDIESVCPVPREVAWP